jgi:riboflavin synthase
MFTGIIQAVGKIGAVSPTSGGVRIGLDSGGLDLDGVKLGDSIAVNGACLTVVGLAAPRLAFDVSRETLACVAGFTAGAPVNLEKALRVGDGLDGHIVSGHVDGIGSVVRITAEGDNRRIAFEVPRELAKYVARKGSVAVDGVSLTVNAVEDCTFEVNLIPHTLAHTNLGVLVVGAKVNIEVDTIARYAERLAQFANSKD